MKKSIWLLAILPLLFSCSKLSVGVHWADTFVFSSLDDCFSFDSEQEDRARSDFNKALREVRRQDFPALAELLLSLADSAEKNHFTEVWLQQWMTQGQQLLRRAAARFEPMGQALVANQSQKGFSRFDAEFESNHQKRAEKIAEEYDRHRQARKRFERVVKETVGFLSAEQEKWVSEEIKHNPLVLENKSRKEVFEKFKLARDSEEKRRDFVELYFHDWESLQSKEYRDARELFLKRSQALILRILKNLSPEQQENLVQNFRRRAGELKGLSILK